jgi:hypothetical protein
MKSFMYHKLGDNSSYSNIPRRFAPPLSTLKGELKELRTKPPPLIIDSHFKVEPPPSTFGKVEGT